jgi:hypothetical protein
VCRQNYSRYLPLYEIHTPKTSRSTSRSKDNDSKSTSSKSKSAPNSNPGKRRSTMNSRDAAYDEAEMMKRAIEASKVQTSVTASSENGNKRSKRGRSDDSDE